VLHYISTYNMHVSEDERQAVSDAARHE
jgi:hypothetical protein